ncbi:HAD hydrolase-like protein [uncultured Campylobacter sp.]|uniref:HAD family hydrolase n=1 Tax=uncultured Campylobacter sp. TaxID=218934 RepID=UPI002606A395|nr:HAD hydrolase-like protein [uncultured Campylobacter sp.]
MPKFQITLLFDLDGTLIDSTPAILDGFHYAFAHLGAAEPSDEAIKRLIGHPLEVMFERLGAARDVQDFVLAYKQRYAQIFLDQTILLSGAFEAVRAASEFANLGVVTTKTSKFSKILLQHLGIAEFFGTIVGREDVRDPKPSAEPILKALENLGICGATASKSPHAARGKTHDATADENTSAASRSAILSEISAPDLKSLPALDPDPSKVYEQNLSSIASQNSDRISFKNLSEAIGIKYKAGDNSQKSGIGIEGESDKGGARRSKIYDTHELNSAPCYDKICSNEILSSVSQNIFMIGDTQLDAIAAKSAGVRSVGVSCGYSSASELRAHFEFVCADAKEAVELIREISSKF